MNNKILKEFYRGNISPAVQSMVRGSPIALATEELAETEKLLTEKLAPELQPIFERLLSAQLSLCHITAEEYYIDGFKTGSRFMMEILDDTHENLKPIAE